MSGVECPQCGLFNPASAKRCDCGYNFKSKLIATSKSEAADAATRSGSLPLLGIAGVMSLIIDLYFLLVDPSASEATQVVNLQKLTLGETFAICGAILIAAEWRPR